MADKTKVRRQGGTAVFSIPPSLLKSLGAGVGTELEVSVEDGCLLIMPLKAAGGTKEAELAPEPSAQIMTIPYSSLAERLVHARRNAGFDSAIAAAESVGVPYPTYAGHENGSSGFPSTKGELYARRFKVRFEWLMSGRGPMVDLAKKYEELLMVFDSLPGPVQDGYMEVLRKLAEPFRPPVD